MSAHTPTLLLDHAIVLVRELHAAEQVLQDAGFALGRSGQHPGLGTHNRLVMFGGGPYLELLAVHTPLPDNAAYRALLAERACTLGLALHSADVPATRQRLLTTDMSCIDIGSVIDAARPLPDGRVARFSILRLAPRALPTAFGFFCQHHTPAAVWENPGAPGPRIAALQASSDAAPLHPALAAETLVTPGAGAAPVALLAAARHGRPVLCLDDGRQLALGAQGLHLTTGEALP
jgi:hypothetical protein